MSVCSVNLLPNQNWPYRVIRFNAIGNKLFLTAKATPGLVAAGATVVVFTTGRGTTIGNAIAPVIKLASNTPVFERMSNDLDLSAGGVIDGTETIDKVGQRVFEHIVAVANGLQAKAEIHKHREFQFWAEQTVSL